MIGIVLIRKYRAVLVILLGVSALYYLTVIVGQTSHESSNSQSTNAVQDNQKVENKNTQLRNEEVSQSDQAKSSNTNGGTNNGSGEPSKSSGQQIQGDSQNPLSSLKNDPKEYDDPRLDVLANGGTVGVEEFLDENQEKVDLQTKETEKLTPEKQSDKGGKNESAIKTQRMPNEEEERDGVREIEGGEEKGEEKPEKNEIAEPVREVEEILTEPPKPEETPGTARADEAESGPDLTEKNQDGSSGSLNRGVTNSIEADMLRKAREKLDDSQVNTTEDLNKIIDISDGNSSSISNDSGKVVAINLSGEGNGGNLDEGLSIPTKPVKVGDPVKEAQINNIDMEKEAARAIKSQVEAKRDNATEDQKSENFAGDIPTLAPELRSLDDPVTLSDEPHPNEQPPVDNDINREKSRSDQKELVENQASNNHSVNETSEKAEMNDTATTMATDKNAAKEGSVDRLLAEPKQVDDHPAVPLISNTLDDISPSGKRRKRNAICTLIYNPLFIAGAQALAYSIKRWVKLEDNIEICALVTKESRMHHLHIHSLESSGWKIVWVPEILPPRSGGNKKLFTKLAVWNLTDYESVLFMDADTLTLKPVRDLFSVTAPFAAARDWGANGEFQANFNGGILLVRPNEREFKRLLKLLADNEQKFDESGAEQGWLNAVYRDRWFELSFFNNIFMAYYTKKRDLWDSIRPYIRIYHMAPDKAFVERSYITKDHENYNMWYQFWYGMIEQTGSNFTFVTSLTCAHSDSHLQQVMDQTDAKPIVIYDLCENRNLHLRNSVENAKSGLFFARFDGCSLDEKLQNYWEESKSKFPEVETLFFELCKPYLLHQVALANPFRSYWTFWLQMDQILNGDGLKATRTKLDSFYSEEFVPELRRRLWQKDFTFVLLNVGTEDTLEPPCEIELFGGTIDAISLHYDSYKSVFGREPVIHGWFNQTGSHKLDYRVMQVCLMPGSSHVATKGSTRDGTIHIISSLSPQRYYVSEFKLSQCHRRVCTFARQS